MQESSESQEKLNSSREAREKSLLPRVAKLLLASIPHLVIVFLFVTYLLIGTAILNEIEISEQEEDQLNLTQLINNTQETITQNQTNEIIKNSKYEAYVMFSQYKLKLNDIYMDVLINLRKHQTDIASNYKSFLSKLDKLLINEIYNRTDENSDLDFDIANSLKTHLAYDSNDSEWQKEKKYINTKKFVSQVFRIQNENSIYLLQTIANHLIETKNGMRQNISKNIKNLLNGYKRKHTDSEKRLFEFIENHLNVFKQSSAQSEIQLDRRAEKEVQAEAPTEEANANEKLLAKNETDMKPLETSSKISFFKSFVFMTNLITTIGYSKEGPDSWISQLFLIFYLLIGLPLGMLFMSVLRSILTLHLKFAYQIISLLKSDNYNLRLLKFFKLKVPYSHVWLQIFSLLNRSSYKNNKSLSQKPLKKSLSEHYGKKASLSAAASADAQTQIDLELAYFQNETFSQFLVDLVCESLERTTNTFNFSVSVSLVFLFIYNLIGSFVFSLVNHDEFQFQLSSFYFVFVYLAKIDLNLIDSSLLNVFIIIYLVLGVALCSLCIQNFAHNLKSLLDENLRKLLLKLILFLNQFGCELKLEQICFDFETFHRANKFSEYTSKSALTLTDDDDLDSTLSRKMSFSGRTYSRRSSQSKKSDTTKSDKQTQITTLLCSKLIKVKELSASCTSFIETSRSVSSATSESFDSKTSSFTFEPKRRLWSDENLNRRYSPLDPITDDLNDRDSIAGDLSEETHLNDQLNNEIKSILNNIETLKTTSKSETELESDSASETRVITTSPTIKLNRFVTTRPLGSDDATHSSTNN